MADEQRRRLADLLEQVLNGTVHPIDALKQAEKWQDMPSNRNDVNVALNALMQFHIHRDVRSKDSEYDEDFRHSLRLHISELRR